MSNTSLFLYCIGMLLALALCGVLITASYICWSLWFAHLLSQPEKDPEDGKL